MHMKKVRKFIFLLLLACFPFFVFAQITKPGYETSKKGTTAPVGPKKFSGNSRIIIEIDEPGTLYVNYKKVWDFKKGDVWESDLPSGMHMIKLTNGQDTWESTKETNSGKQLIVVTNLKSTIHKRKFWEEKLEREIEQTKLRKRQEDEQRIKQEEEKKRQEDEDRRKAEEQRRKELLKIGTTGSFIDSRDGQLYKTITFGNGQSWMAENLNFDLSGSMCYDKSSSNCYKYGRLYTWQQAKQACPPGWRLPTKGDFEKLDGLFDYNERYEFLIKGGKSGFNAELGGYHNAYLTKRGFFSDNGKFGYYWGITEEDRSRAWGLEFYTGTDHFRLTTHLKSSSFSCRCIKDE